MPSLENWGSGLKSVYVSFRVTMEALGVNHACINSKTELATHQDQDQEQW